MDTLGHRVLAYDIGGPVRLLFSVGSLGVGEGEFNYPNSIAVDKEGRLFVTDRENDRVQVWGY